MTKYNISVQPNQMAEVVQRPFFDTGIYKHMYEVSLKLRRRMLPFKPFPLPQQHRDLPYGEL